MNIAPVTASRRITSVNLASIPATVVSSDGVPSKLVMSPVTLASGEFLRVPERPVDETAESPPHDGRIGYLCLGQKSDLGEGAERRRSNLNADDDDAPTPSIAPPPLADRSR
jgi:hypothetical protein